MFCFILTIQGRVGIILCFFLFFFFILFALMLLSRFYQVHDVEPMLLVLSASMNRINHYANMSMQCTAIFKVAKTGDFQLKKRRFFFLFLLKT